MYTDYGPYLSLCLMILFLKLSALPHGHDNDYDCGLWVFTLEV